ncbi:hypothetical protein AAHA92_06029 [Salvia divinorum]|uniref:Myb/SANT-like domain-containing protein n=1 Tax=Salvia divinorum TaxID=28513 RepID=A0ABD1I6L6_SALDI
MNPCIPPQEAFFYNGKWSQQLDRLLLSTVLRIKGRQPWAGNAVPESVMYEAMKSIIKEGDASEICINDIKVRLDELKARYTTFNELVATRGVQWDHDSNVVIADDEIVWRKILKQHPFAGAYYHTDEPQLYLLASMFGLTDVEMEDETIIIITSDTTKPICNLHGPLVASPADPDEVNSPCVGGAFKARRKLFVEESATDDRHSSTVASVFYHGTGVDGSLKLKMENQPPCCMNLVKINQSKFSPGGSSTASCSPFLRSHNIAP